MPEEKNFEKIHQYLNQYKGRLKILEEQVDVEMQKEYFQKSTTNSSNKFNTQQVINEASAIFESGSEDDIKECLLRLAAIDEVKAYRIIESYMHSAPKKLKSWTILALQESRMGIESSLLDEEQIYISTGLGGIDDKIRYFIVLVCKEGIEINHTQKKIISNEFSIFSGKHDSIIETIDFEKGYAKITALIPLSISIKDFTSQVVKECNQYGDFLMKRFIVTNVKRLSEEEIRTYVSKYYAKKKIRINPDFK